MADVSLQAESVRANPAPVSLHSAAVALEGLSDELAELSALVRLASQSAQLDEGERAAFRAIVARLDGLSAKAEGESEAFLAAGRAVRPGLQ